MSAWTRTVLQDGWAHRYTSGAYRIDVQFGAPQGADVTLYTPDGAAKCGNLAAAKRAAKAHQKRRAAPEAAVPAQPAAPAVTPAPTVPAAMVLEAVRGCLNFPFPQICRHLVACDLLEILGRVGYVIPDDLARAVVKADDARALALLEAFGATIAGQPPRPDAT